MDRQKFIEKTRNSIDNYFSNLKNNNIHPINDVVNILNGNNIVAYTIGGFPRDVFLNNATPNDIDLIFEEKESIEFLASSLPNSITKKNIYNGYKIIYNGLKIDAWPLHETWAYKQNIIENKNFNNLVYTTFLNIESIIVEISPLKEKKRKVYIDGFYNAVNDKTLELNLEKNPYPELNIIRALHLSHILSFNIGSNLSNYIKTNIQTLNKNELERIRDYKYNCTSGFKKFLELIMNHDNAINIYNHNINFPFSKQLKLAF